MSQPLHISEIFLQIAADPKDQLGQALRRCPFIQAELIRRKMMSGNSSSTSQAEGKTMRTARLRFIVTLCGDGEPGRYRMLGKFYEAAALEVSAAGHKDRLQVTISFVVCDSKKFWRIKI